MTAPVIKLDSGSLVMVTKGTGSNKVLVLEARHNGVDSPPIELSREGAHRFLVVLLNLMQEAWPL